VRFGQYGGGLFVALVGEHTEHTGKHVSRRVTAGNFSRPRRVDSWHWSYAGRLDASHAPNAANKNSLDYGDDPSLPSYLTTNGAVYKDVGDLGTDRIQAYTLSMHTVDAQEVLRRIRQELPSDATVAWDLTLNRCCRVAFNSPTLQAAGHSMADVELEYIQEDGTTATSPDRFNIASFWLDEAGSPPNPEKGC
jgi:hypothetical protein